MAVGSWGLKLKPATPFAIRSLLDYYGHVYVFDTPQRPGTADAIMISSSRWGGVVRIRATPWDLGGGGMVSWLGDEDGNGPILEAAVTKAASTFATWAPSLLPVAVTAGTIQAGGTTVATTYGGVTAGQTPITPRVALDNLCGITGFEYRVNKNFTLDAGTGSALFKTTPTAVAMWRSSGRDLTIVGLPVTQFDVSIDAEQYITRALVHDATGAYTGATGSVTPYKDGLGNLLKMTKVIESAQTPTANAAALAANLVAAQQVLRNAVTLASNQFDIRRDVEVGDMINAYDVDGTMVDTTNPVRYRGSLIYPMKLRVMAMTWPFERGLGVWYRDRNGVWTDLTNYIVWENPGVTFEVGAPVRPLTK